jgi:hypothetical protein
MQVVRWRFHWPPNSFASWYGMSVALPVGVTRVINPVIYLSHLAYTAQSGYQLRTESEGVRIPCL